MLALALPVIAGADGDSAQTDACVEASGAVRACSSKELSNVVLQCGDESGTYFVKFDELDDGMFEGLITPYEGNFSCPQGDVIAVFIKSGRNGYDGPAIEGLPSGSGAQWSPLACGTEERGCASSGEGGEDEGGGEEGGGGDENVDSAG
jgi:hypothetical protein